MKSDLYCYNILEVYIKSDHGYLYAWTHFPDHYKTQKMCGSFISKDPS